MCHFRFISLGVNPLPESFQAIRWKIYAEEKTKRIKSNNNAGAYNSPNLGNEYVLVKVHLRNTSSNDEMYNTFDFHLKSGTGNITDPDSQTYDTSLNGLSNGTLAANGGAADGDIVFQVKKGDHKAELT